MFSARGAQAKKGRETKSSKTQRTPMMGQDREIEELKARTDELDRVAKMLVRRDLELSETRTRREQEVEELKAKTKELEEARSALLNMLEDTEAARRTAEQSRKETGLIIQDLADGLLVLNSEGVIELVNPQAERLFLLGSKRVIGKRIQDLKELPVMKELAELIEKEKDPIFRHEFEIGERTLTEITVTPFHPGHGKSGLLITVHDISREQEIERMKIEFVSLTAHQLRTPLAAIKWSTQMLLDGDEGELLRDQAELLRKSLQATDRMIRLINDLLNVTRIEEGRYLHKPSFQQLGDIVKSMVKSYQDTATQKKIRLELKIPKKGIPRILMDAEKIQLVAQNLLENALHYTPSGGEVTVELHHDTKEVRVSFKDTGIGIPQEQQQRVFEKFFRAANARRMDTSGSGLGLYLAYNIVEAHGGKIWFESEKEKGTTFTFSLPIKEKITEF